MYKKLAKSSIGIIIGGIFLYLTLNKKPLNEIFLSLSNANMLWIIISSIGLLVIFYFRALRWKVLLSNAGYDTTKYDVVYSLILGYLVNSFTPKLGEIIRCTSLKKYTNIPVSKSLGTVVSERLYDVLVLLIGFFIIVALEISYLGEVLKSLKDSLVFLIVSNYIITIITTILLILTIAIAYYLSKKNKVADRISKFFQELAISMKQSFKMKNYKSFILYTSYIWILLIVVNYAFLRSLPETADYSVYFASMVLFIGGIGWALPSPGGIGTTNFIILQLFIAFKLNTNVGVSFGLLASGITFGVTVGFGLLAVLFNQIKVFSVKKKISE